MSPVSLAQSIADTRQRVNEVLTGDVVLVTSTSIGVVVRGVQITAAYLRSYVPVAGDLVAVVRQDASWLCLGALAGVGANQVLNPSFEQGGAAPSTPPSWFLANTVGTGAASTVATGSAVAGTFELLAEGVGGGAATFFVYSSPISVVTGQQWSLSAWCAGVYTSGIAPGADAAVAALWFANDTNLYPTTSSADSVLATATDVAAGPGHTSVSGTVTVPGGGTTYMRLALRSTLAAGESLLWDSAVARRIA